MAPSKPPAGPVYLLGKVIEPDTRQTLWTLEESLVSTVSQDASLVVVMDRAHRLGRAA